MSKTLQLSVEKVQFKITPNGNLFPLISFNSTKELTKMGIDAIAMPNLDAISDYQIGKGSKLKVKFEDEKLGFQPEIQGILKKAVRIAEMPLDCPSCTRPLVDKEDHVTCLNVYCSGQSRGMIYKMIKLSNVVVETELITEFLDTYSDGSATCRIDNMEEFKLLFTQIKHKDTQARENHWIKSNPKNGTKLWELEMSINNFLNKAEIRSGYFWCICNFPDIQENEVHQLSKINPKKLLNMEYDLKKLNLTPRVQRYLSNNITFINFLNNFFESFGEKTWIH